MSDSSSSDEAPARQIAKQTKPKVEFEDPDAHPGITLVDGLRIVFGLLLLSGLLSYFITGDSVFWGYNAWWTKPKALVAKLRGPVVLTDAQLLHYNGEDESLPIYLALNSTIYDVTSNPRIYGPGGMYAVFSGRDAARGFVTGCFAEDNHPDLRGVEWQFVPKDVPTYEEKSDEELTEQMRLYRKESIEKGFKEIKGTIEHWQKVFRGETGKDYFEVGYISGRKPESGPVKPLCQNAEKKRPKEGLEKWIQKRRLDRANAEKEEKGKPTKDEI
ncbi:hypothetical protein CKM354_000980400 [Cercospora kikuchii]|uniref:Cytochrome b5 heme-binding domain-containing protein n=1 Tax=Cercospora kikuchii TaxID=84275 RepID=A0A9P3CQ94_9PEZI|nr:uncharacterized protein CKM354_000980400 [Cercospora kikuchii]GIZ46686.1 hypothetical protein CKM354_000980400 [Cercospora kikuchii]